MEHPILKLEQRPFWGFQIGTVAKSAMVRYVPTEASSQVERKTISIMKACELVGVSRRTIYNWLSSGKIEYVRTAEPANRPHPITEPLSEPRSSGCRLTGVSGPRAVSAYALSPGNGGVS